VDVVVKGRNVEVPDHYRVHVTEKLHKIERYDQKIIEVSVELLHERNPRQSDNCQRIEITCVSRGPVVRAEACASDFYAALDKAIDKLNTRLRRAADRRRVHRGRHAPVSVATATAPLAAFDGR
jgi:ribosomal subunit interface protein